MQLLLASPHVCADSTQAELYEHADEESLCKWDFEHVNLALPMRR
jgi:hypothetical protein